MYSLHSGFFLDILESYRGMDSANNRERYNTFLFGTPSSVIRQGRNLVGLSFRIINSTGSAEVLTTDTGAVRYADGTQRVVGGGGDLARTPGPVPVGVYQVVARHRVVVPVVDIVAGLRVLQHARQEVTPLHQRLPNNHNPSRLQRILEEAVDT